MITSQIYRHDALWIVVRGALRRPCVGTRRCSGSLWIFVTILGLAARARPAASLTTRRCLSVSYSSLRSACDSSSVRGLSCLHQARKPAKSRNDDSVSKLALYSSASSTFGSASTLSTTDDSSSRGGGRGRWDSFDYLRHWYPVCWEVDMPLGYPTKQSLFDQDYAVVLTPDRKVMAYIDRCPHRSAALSQGRLTSNSKYLQCAYHGWSFDAEGKCVEIPQNIPAAATDGTSKSSPSYSPRACATAISATLHQGMVWLWPALDHPPTSLPPTVPELDDPDFRTVRLVRDFPVIDWSILLSNIMDPDHGMFAHQLPSFDLYSGSPEFPMKVSEEFPSQQGGGVGWMMTCRVPAADKLMQRKKKQQQESSTKSKHSSQQQQRQLRTSTTTYMAPAVVTMGRRDDQNRTSFLSGFWVSPTGAGKSRFLTATAARNVPFSVPRWFQHVFLNAFLDQDSVLVASQQPHTLLAEAERYEGQTSVAGGARQSTYVYQSPSDRMVRLIDAFFDATLSRSPNRVARLREMKASGALRTYPPREVVLDLESQHLRICQDSRDAVRNCKMIIGASTLLTLGWLALKVSGRMAGLPKPFRSAAWPALATLAGWSANFFRRRFYYGYTIDKLRRDLAKIPSKTWADP